MAFSLAIVIYCLFVLFTCSVVWISKDAAYRGRFQNSMSNQEAPVQYCAGSSDWSPSPPAPSSHYPKSARTVFDLPLSSDSLYLFARGSLAHGSATILADAQEGADKVRVDVIVSYYTDEGLDHAKVCSLQRQSGQNGVGIFTPKLRDYSREERLRFDIVVHFPAQHSHLLVNAFETTLPMFSHTVADIANSVEFRRLSLMSSNMPINVSSLHAHHATLATSNSPITGSFHASTSLVLSTSNAPITAQVGLLNHPAGNATGLIMTTSNAYIDSSISLSSSQDKKGSFNVNATTSNGPLKLKYKTSPVDSILYSSARTCNSPVDVVHHSAFEGTISLVSTIFSPFIDKKNVEDPSGQGRLRSLEVVEGGRGAVTGVVYWGADKTNMTGFTEIMTTNSPVHLRV